MLGPEVPINLGWWALSPTLQRGWEWPSESVGSWGKRLTLEAERAPGGFPNTDFRYVREPSPVNLSQTSESFILFSPEQP